jgi:hypothetical protein
VRDSGRGVVCEPTAEAFADGIRAVLAAPPGEADPAWLRGHSWDAMSDRVIGRVLA